MRLCWQHDLSIAPRKLEVLDSISFGKDSDDFSLSLSQYAAKNQIRRYFMFRTLLELPKAHLYGSLLLSILAQCSLVHLQMQTWADCQTCSKYFEFKVRYK